jgi:GR25 family glycosyltransferase involved in LPS biosynthesis
MQNEIFKILKEYTVKTYKVINDKKNEYFINKTVDNVYIINLNDNVIRRNYMIILMKKYNINFNLVVVNRLKEEVYENIKKKINNEITKEEAGCSLSHLWCLKNAKKNKYEKIIIFEDDTIFHKNFLELFEKIIQKKTYDFLLLGRCDFCFNHLHSKTVKNGLYRPHPKAKMLYGAHANYYSLEGAKKMWELKTKNFSFFDSDYLSMFDHFKETSSICYPDLIVTDLSTSNLDHNYYLLTNMEKNYYINCFDRFHFQDYHFIYLDLLDKYGDLPINKEDTYESYMNKLIDCYFFTDMEREEIRDRLTKDFFTIKDISLLVSFTSK